MHRHWFKYEKMNEKLHLLNDLVYQVITFYMTTCFE